jgi:tetratricopeptide (TPR) repeat protein/predicted TPR repeat methyltransferase
MRTLNLPFLLVLLAVVAVLGVGMHFVHGYQVQRNASALLERADRAEADKDLEKAEQALQQYLNLRREDVAAWKRYARVVDQRDPDHLRRQPVFLVHEEALRHNPEDSELERRCADLALELERYKDAQRHLTSLLAPLLAKLPKDSQSQPAAELEDLLGQCERGLGQFDQAEGRFTEALKHDPGRLDCYDRLARLRRGELRRIADGDGTIQKMVAKNPKAGRAYMYRWRYAREFATAPNADDLKKAADDLKKALELAPDDPEVLLTVAIASEQKSDAAAARTYFEKGFQRDPTNLALALGLASLEGREGHLDRAEEILRRADQARPSLDLAFARADNLIRQGKITSKDQADDTMTRLRKAGLGETLVRYLEAEILVRQQHWGEAIPQLEIARAILRADHRLTAGLNLMLAECYSRRGSAEQRLDALQQAAAGDEAPDSARIEFARALARSGQLDKALTILAPLAERQPELRLDLVRLLIQKTIRQPRDRQDWPDVERQLRAAEQAPPQARAVEPLTLLRADMLAAQDNLEAARSLLAAAQAKEPRNLRYRLVLARLTQRAGRGAEALRIIDQAETDLGPSLDVQLARLDYWGLEGGKAARAALAKLAATRQQVPAADRPALLERLGSVAIRLRELNQARQYGRELADLQPEDLRIRLTLFDLAREAGDHDGAAALVREIRAVEGEAGTFGQFAQATFLIDQVRRGASQDLEEARELAVKIAERQPAWWVGPTLIGEIAELSGSTDQAITSYTRAVELGNVQPSLARRLVGLLNQRNQTDEIDRVAQKLRDQGAALNDVTLVRALDAIRREEFDRGIALARQVFPESSTNASDHLSLGRIYLTAGRSDAAGQEFRRAVELGPGVPDTWLNYVRYLVQARRIDQARAAVEAARKALPAERATSTLAQCFLVLGDARQAEALIQEALADKDKPADPATLRLAVTVALSQNRLDQIEEYLNRLDAIAGASTDDKAWVNRTRAALVVRKDRLDRQGQGLRLVEQNLRVNPGSIEDQVLKANILAFRPDRRNEAITILERLAGANRLGAYERFLLAQLYLGNRDEAKYQGEMLKLLQPEAGSPQHLVHFVNYWIGRNQLDQAGRWLAELKKAEPKGLAALELEVRLLDLRKQKPELLALLEARGREVPDQIGPVADLLSRYGFAKEAEAAYKAFIARDPKQPERVLALAGFLAGHDRPAEAMAILKQAWSTCRPEQVAAAAFLVVDAPSAGEAEKRQVEAWVAEAARQRPDAVGLRVKLATLWLRQGRVDEAEGLYRRILAESPDHADALNGLAWLLALRDQGKAREALELINHAIEVTGADPSLVDTRAVVLIRAGQLDRALGDLDLARAGDPRNPSFALHRAWAYREEGKTDEARKAFQQAQDLGWKVAKSDPLERSCIDKLQHDLARQP